MKHLRFFKDFLIEQYGRALYRIPLDLPLGCPNREQNRGRGCIYCADDGNRARHLRHGLSLAEQVKKGIAYASERYGAEPPYIAYFQSFSNTFGPVERLRQYYEEALAEADFKLAVISTRPDCLPPETLDLLSELNARYDLWIELGVQSSNDATLERIQRGHDFAAVRDAVAKLTARNIKCAAHVILGLPGETVNDWRQTARDLASLPFAAVKLHNLLVLRNTPLAKMFASPLTSPEIQPLNEYEYADAATEFLRILPERLIIMRLTADAPEKEIIAPKWWMKKGHFLEFFKSRFQREDNADMPGIETQDGSFTVYHPEFKQHFHSLAGAKSEALEKFIAPANLRQRLRERKIVRLLDIGFGLGYNAIEAAKLAEKEQSGHLEIVSLELDRRPLKAALKLYPPESRGQQIIAALLAGQEWRGKFSGIKLHYGDARKTLRDITGKFDAVFMDGFSPDKNVELWTLDFVRLIKKITADNGIITTYSSAYPVQGAILRAGLAIGLSAPFGRKRGGSVAARDADMIQNPLPKKELDIIQKSTAGVPYRDVKLKATEEEIFARRKALVSRLRTKGIPKWHKTPQ